MLINSGIGTVFGMEGFWEVQLDVNTLLKLYSTLSHTFLSDCEDRGIVNIIT